MDDENPPGADRYKASSLRAYNERLPERYDTSLVVRFFNLSVMDDFVIAALGDGMGDRAILDVGCATGRLLERLARAGARRLSGSDLAPRILDVARRKLSTLGAGVELRSADAETSLPWPSDSFDVVTLTGVFHHFSEPAAALREMRRVLRPGGKLVLADPCFFPPVRELFNLCLRIHPRDGDRYFYTTTQVRQKLSARGWEVGVCVRLNWWAFGVVARPIQGRGV